MGLKPFEQVVAEQGPTVWRVCRALLGPAEAEDAWAETFVSALRAYPQLAAGSDVQAWLVTIAHRKAIDQHRLGRRVPVPMAVLPELISPEPVDRDETLWAALQALPPGQRAAVAYHYVGGLPYAEVAQILGNSEQAARRAAADGIKKLRVLLSSRSRGPQHR